MSEHSAEKRSDAPESSVEFEPSPERAVERAKEFYELVGPRIGSHLVEANVALTLADARGQTEFSVIRPDDEVMATLEALNRSAEPRGIRFEADKQTRAFDNQPIAHVNMETLAGYAVASRQTRIPGVTPFDPTSGWEGLRQWKEELMQSLLAAQQRGEIPLDEECQIYFEGIIKGYPDIAIRDFASAYGKREREQRLVSSTLPFLPAYSGAEPNYDFDRDHSFEPEIIEHRKNWSDILERFYISEWHDQLRRSEEFREARQNIDVWDEEGRKIVAEREKARRSGAHGGS